MIIGVRIYRLHPDAVNRREGVLYTSTYDDLYADVMQPIGVVGGVAHSNHIFHLVLAQFLETSQTVNSELLLKASFQQG